MAEALPLTRDGTPWTPQYVEAIDPATCIGCGRCYKVCSHQVLVMMGIDEDGSLVPADDDDAERMVMTLGNKGNCIGCYACGTICGTGAITHIVLDRAA